MKKFSISKNRLRLKIYLLLSLTFLALVAALVSVSYSYLERTTEGDARSFADRFRYRFSTELNAKDYFPIVSSIDREIDYLNWISVSFTVNDQTIYIKKRDNQFARLFSTLQTASFDEKNKVNLTILVAPQVESLYLILSINIFTFLMVVICSSVIAAAFFKENEFEIRRSTISQNLVHDLRGMAGAIKTIALDKDADSRVETIVMVAKKIEEIVVSAKLLDSSAHQVGTDSVQSLAALIDEVLLSVPESKSLVSVTVDFLARSINLSELDINPASLWRVFYNLFRNSTHPTVETKKIIVGVSLVPDSFVEITFADDGKGISPELMPHVFEKGVTAGKVDGSGLGLFLAKEMVEKAGGSLTLSAADTGATFIIRIQLRL